MPHYQFWKYYEGRAMLEARMDDSRPYLDALRAVHFDLLWESLYPEQQLKWFYPEEKEDNPEPTWAIRLEPCPPYVVKVVFKGEPGMRYTYRISEKPTGYFGPVPDHLLGPGQLATFPYEDDELVLAYLGRFRLQCLRYDPDAVPENTPG